MPYYGLYIPSKNVATAATATNSADEQTSTYIFDTKEKALEVLKSNKDGRMREFQNEEDAKKYADTGYEEVITPKYADPKGASTAAVEKAAFRAPSKQELIEFRKVIEAGDYERVKAMIWDNPRYLVSSGDTPTSLKEGYRYNALHICSISKKPKIAELILKTVSDPKFVDLLTGKKNDEKMCKELCKNLLDYYLNIPDKGRSETPLHFATKIGCVEMVELLTSYPECRMKPNSEGKSPKEIICLRQPTTKPEIYKKIETLLEERFYVPVLRSVDNDIPPEIGEPFQLNKPPNLNTDPLSPEVKILALAGPMQKDQANQFRRRWKTPPRIGSNNSSSPIANNPFISPRYSNMSITPIKNFNGFDSRTPTATLQRRALFNSSPRNSSQENNYKNHTENEMDAQNGNYNFKQPDENKILIQIIAPETESEAETTNNNNNNKTNEQQKSEESQGETTNNTNNAKQFSTICPATPILRMKKSAFFTYREPNNAISSPIVFEETTKSTANALSISSSIINLNDSFQLNIQDQIDSPGYKERHVKISDHEKGLELIGRELAREQKVEWREYWDFLDDYLDIATEDGLLKLENHFAQRIKETETTTKRSIKTTLATATVALDDVCSALEKLGFSRDDNLSNSTTALRNSLNMDGSSGGNRFDLNITNNAGATASATTPYTCVEKSLQVFAKRMTKTIIHNVENVVCINDTLLSELKRLKSLICSFKEDKRFIDINFSKVHSRIANLISIYLQNSQEVTLATKAKILVVIQNLQNTSGERREHIECVCSKIFQKLMNQDIKQILPESLKTEESCSKAWLKEDECECQWDNNLSRKTSRRNRLEARFKNSHQTSRQQKSHPEEAANDDWCFASSDNNSSEEDDFRSVSESESDNEDIWYTPSSSPRLFPIQETGNSDYKLFVHGNEPTKRDLDVLNAIFHLEIDSKKYPNVHTWKAAMLRFPNEEMDYFPSPAIVKKSHSFASTRKLLNTPIKAEQKFNSEQKMDEILKSQTPIAKKLFNNTTPVRSKMFGSILGNDNSGGVNGPPKTPLNKLRGLFSSYRTNNIESPLPNSPITSNLISNNDDSKNLSLFNISTAE